MEYGRRDTEIVYCGGSSCVSEFQDKRYGKNMRVANHASNKGQSKDRYRCATCKKEHIVKERS